MSSRRPSRRPGTSRPRPRGAHRLRLRARRGPSACSTRRRWDELAAAQASGTALALLFLDLDGFKQVNDDLGHAAGDELLVVPAQRLRGQARAGDLLARHGGDEFVLALPGLLRSTAERDAAGVARRLREAVRQPVTLHGRQVQVGVSVGISVSLAVGGDVRTLLRLADQRMYEAKLPRQREACERATEPVVGLSR